MQFNTPILFLVFNRVDTTKRVFETIRQIKPKQLFIAADGPRDSVVGEINKCVEVRDLVLKNIDWECEVKTLFREQNLGCGKAVSQAITWFFENVEQGIILEDDTLPDLSFFEFCETLLEKYKNDVRIQSICGANLLADQYKTGASYIYSIHSGIWGWATWKRAWDNYDYSISKWRSPEVAELFKASIVNPVEREMYVSAFDKMMINKGVDTWDLQWIFARIIHSGFGIIPAKNLVSNIGFGIEATHTREANPLVSNLAYHSISFPLIAPKLIAVNHEYDEKLSNTFYKTNSSKVDSLLSKIKSLIKK